MDIKALIKNIADSVKTTVGLSNAQKKLYWLYNRSSAAQTLIKFKYPAPLGKIDLIVRDNNGADVFIMSEVFEHQCYYMPLNANIKRILDLGSNAGFTAIYLSKYFPQATIACVEPMPNNIIVLKKNLALNKVNHVLFEAAATINDQTIMMEVADKDYANKVHDIPFGKDVSDNTLPVTGLSITTILEKLNWSNIDLLKIDIEGYEGILLSENNSWLYKVDNIVIEIHEGITIDFVKNITTSFGFDQAYLQKGNWVLSKSKIS